VNPEAIGELRAAVVANPDDDAPREVLADALLEAGDLQGELIRVQLAAAPDDRKLGMRERELVNLVGPALVAGLPPGEYRLRRGTIHGARLDADTWIDAAAELHRRGPVEDLHADGPEVEKLCRLGPLDGLRAFGITNARPAAIHALADRLPSAVRELTLGTGGLDQDAGWRIAHLPLRRFQFLCSRDTLAFATTIIESRIPEIDLTGSPLTDAGATVLARLRAIGRRGVLALDRCGIGDEGVAALAASPHLVGLRELTLEGNPITSAGSRALAGSPLAASLERLRTVSRDDHWPLVNGAFPRLRELAVTVSERTPFSRGPVLAQLDRLELRGLLLRTDELAALLAAAPRVRHLALSMVLGPEAARMLAAAPQLETLDLSAARIGTLDPARKILRARYGWRVEFEPRWEPWVRA
jgi:uncharacterized protein (TIGR02996 family)